MWSKENGLEDDLRIHERITAGEYWDDKTIKRAFGRSPMLALNGFLYVNVQEEQGYCIRQTWKISRRTRGIGVGDIGAYEIAKV